MRLALAGDAEHIGLMLRAQISRVAFDQVEESRVLAEADPLIRKALASFEEAKRLAKAGQYGKPGARNRTPRPDNPSLSSSGR